MIMTLQGKSDELFSTAEAAKFLGLSENTIRTYVARGKLRPLRFGQTLVFPRKECERYNLEKLPQGKQKKTR
jgi:excisionase family DNA binding protein